LMRMMKSVVCCLACVALCVCAVNAKALNLKNLKGKIPKVKADDSNVFTPGPFPCSYTALYSLTLSDEEESLSIKGYQSVYGRYFSGYRLSEGSDRRQEQHFFLRADMKSSSSDYGTVIETTNSDGYLQCSSYSIFWTPTSSDYSGISYIYSFLNEEFYYDSVSDDKWMDQSCRKYTGEDGSIYVDSVGHVIGFDENIAGQKYVGYVVYELNSAYESDFMLPSSYTGCGTEPEAYNPPGNESGCTIISGARPTPTYPGGSGTGGSGSGASVNKVYSLLVLASILIAFISFF